MNSGEQKPTVYFTGHARLHGAGNGKTIAHIYDVLEHPVLGDNPWVSTSFVVDHNSVDGSDPTYIETRNTIYKQAVKE